MAFGTGLLWIEDARVKCLLHPLDCPQKLSGEVELIVSPLLLLHEEGVIEKEGALSPVEILAVAVARPQDLRREATPCV